MPQLSAPGIGLVVLLLLGALLFLAAQWVWTIMMLTRPRRRGYAWALAHQRPSHPGELATPAEFTEWAFTSGGNELPAWDIEGGREAGPTVVFTPGWGQGRIGCLDRVEALLPHCRRLVVWDTPHTGEAEGVCTLGAGELTMLDELLDRLGPDQPTVLAGCSMGAGLSIAAAARRNDIAGVIAEAPYRVPLTPALGVLRSVNLPHALTLRPAIGWIGLTNNAGARWEGFDRAELAASLGCPVLVLHGSEDDVCPLADGQAIAGAASDGTLVRIEGGDHHQLWREPAWRAIAEQAASSFLARFDQPAGVSTTSP